jgi:hypothetical protein
MHKRALIPVTLEAIRAAAPHRKPGYEAAALQRGKLEGQTIWLTPKVHAEIRTEFAMESDLSEWPAWAVLASLFRGDGDRGVGDTLARELGGAKSERFKVHHEAIFGIWDQPCGCQGKVAEWNRVYGYGASASAPAPVAD